MLTPSDRINTIKEIASRLSKEDWPLIDLTLKQFSLPWTDEWRGDEHGYIIEMLSNAPDENLEQLASHVGYDISDERSVVEPVFWKSGHFRLFVGHLAEQKEYATKLQSELHDYQISTFVAHVDIAPTREWQDEIELALNTADALVALLTPGFHQSNWTDQEIGFAMGRGILSVAVKLRQEPYGFISKLQAFQGEGKDEKKLAAEMFEAFLINKLTQRRMSLALLSKFENSFSFEEAKKNIRLLERMDYWDPLFADRIREAVQSNDQIKRSFGVPEQAESLIRKRSESDSRR